MLLASAEGQYARPATFVDQVRRCVLEGLRQQDVNAARLARQIGVSPRTLHRRLQEHGTSYQTLLDTVRCDLARSYLGERHLASDEVPFCWVLLRRARSTVPSNAGPG